MPRLEDYPFDPRWRGLEHELDGLNKLRAVESPAMRATLFELWQNTREDRPREENPAQQKLFGEPKKP